MNIGIVTTWFERGAAYVSRQYRDTLLKKHRVYIYARAGEDYAKGDPAWDDDTIWWGVKGFDPGSTRIDINDFQRWLVEKRISIVLFNEQLVFEPVLFCNRMGYITGAYVDYYTEDTIPFYGIYDFLLCNTKKHFSAFDWHPRAYYIPWGTNIETYSCKNYDAVAPPKISFFHSCGMSPGRKGTENILKAIPLLKGDFRIVIHSQVKLREVYPQYEKVIDEYLKKEMLVLIEKSVTAPGLYHMGDVYVYPTFLEGIGLTIIEALSSGLPVVTSDNGPMNEFVNSENGQLVKIDRVFARSDGYYWPQCLVNVEALAQCLQHYIDTANDIGKYKKAARSYAERCLDWSQKERSVYEVFEEAGTTVPEENREIAVRIERYESRYRNNIGYLLYNFSPLLYRFCLSSARAMGLSG
jgi:1,2-diacylglycerol 3-alpha-glucosyltransferase